MTPPPVPSAGPPPSVALRSAVPWQELARRYGTPLYVDDLTLIRARVRQLRDAITYRPFLGLYAMKANPAPLIVATIAAEGFGIDAVSPGEVALALRAGVPAERILYTENNMTDAEMAAAQAAGVLITCGSLDRLERLAASGARRAAVRFNPEIGAGAHEKICTAGPLTKFGIHQRDLAAVRRIEASSALRVVGCHMHIGSGFLDAAAFVAALQVLLGIAEHLPHLEFIDFGGGIGIPYRDDEPPMDIAALGRAASRLMQAFADRRGRQLEMRLEPGRFLVAEAGTLLTTVTSIKTNPPAADGSDPGRTFVGCDTGFNHLIRVSMYDAYHAIANLSRPQAPPATVDIVGNICESGDVFARARPLPRPELGDLLALRDAGAYGMAMASTYNTRPLPAEVAWDGSQVHVVRDRQTIDALLATYRWPERAAAAGLPGEPPQAAPG